MDNEIQKLKTNEDNLKSKASTRKQVSDKQHKNVNLNQLFEKPFTQRTPRHMSIEPQTSTYTNSLQNQNEKNTYNYITRTYSENIHKIQTYLNLNPRSTTKEPNQDYLTQKLQGYNKLIARPKTNANLRIIDISTIIQELANNYLNGNAIWRYYARDQLMIYSNSRELKKADMDKLEERPTTRALKVGFISTELLTRYCKLIGHKYPDHICSKCNGEDNIIPNVDLE
ncbi:hypothetical protein H5410_027389 [Solanum commersonii]|uniref:Uncharacterized protein n=1 Tax=Solanum commersonii TaxID=4109 RepID=A0A9J5YZ26_SOLCO|nr:hypothetical protein H5410_027389 [Solanum commersonii]